MLAGAGYISLTNDLASAFESLSNFIEVCARTEVTRQELGGCRSGG